MAAGALGEEDLRMLECSICMNYPRNPMESNCCAQVICKICVDELNPNSLPGVPCPLCRQNFATSPVRGALKRLIDNISIECENGCGSLVKLGNIEDHEKLCAKANVTCKFCENLVSTKHFIDHLTSVHSTDLIKSCSTTSGTSSLVDVDPSARRTAGNTPIEATGGGVDMFRPTVNSYGKNAKLGETGKFYCGNQLEFACSCCNGRCGPDNGCNCKGCQQLDIRARNLPKRAYVNSHGCVSFRDNMQDSFFCLRTVSNSTLRAPQFVCDGSRNLCRSCRGLNTAWNVCAAFRNINS